MTRANIYPTSLEALSPSHWLQYQIIHDMTGYEAVKKAKEKDSPRGAEKEKRRKFFFHR